MDSKKLFCVFVLQMHIDSHDALGVLNTLFEILAPSSLRPVDMLLRSMFVTPKTMVSNCFQRSRGSGVFHAKQKITHFSLSCKVVLNYLQQILGNNC